MGVKLSKRTASSIRKWIKKLRNTGDVPKIKRKARAYKKLRLKYKYLSRGSNRIVYDMGKKVLKVAISIRGISNIQNEARLYRKSPKLLRKHLGKVYTHGDGWLIMKKAKRTIPRTSRNKKRVMNVKKKFLKKGINPVDIFYTDRTEPEWRNLGIKKGRKIVVLDYGHFKWKQNKHKKVYEPSKTEEKRHENDRKSKENRHKKDRDFVPSKSKENRYKKDRRSLPFKIPKHNQTSRNKSSQGTENTKSVVWINPKFNFLWK